MMLAISSGLVFAALAYWWPLLVSYPMPEYYEWLTVMDKLPLWVGQAVAGIAAIVIPWVLWPRSQSGNSSTSCKPRCRVDASAAPSTNEGRARV